MSDFMRALKFGVIDNGVLIISSLVGFSLDDYIAERVGHKGYGVLVGATVGNAISDGMAGIPEGGKAAFGYFAGALAPIVPLGMAMAAKHPLDKGTRTVLTITSATLVGLAFLKRAKTGEAKRAPKAAQTPVKAPKPVLGLPPRKPKTTLSN